MKRWGVWVTTAGAVISGLIFFTPEGDVDYILVQETSYTAPQLTQTIVAGPDLATIPTPNPNSRDIGFVSTPVEGSIYSEKTIYSVRPAGSDWGPGESGTPGPNGAVLRHVTLDLTADQAVSIRAKTWRVIITDTIPTGVEVIP